MGIKDDRKSAIKKIRAMTFNQKTELEKFRNKMEATFTKTILPNRVEKSDRDYGGVKCDMLIPEIYSPDELILYIHGGSFAGGSRSSYRDFCASLANICSTRVLIPEFRLPPAFSYPRGIDDLEAIIKTVQIENEIEGKLKKNRKPLELILAADGSGASLLFGLFYSLEEKYRGLIKNIILFSPWLDLSLDDSILAQKRIHDEVLNGENIRFALSLYAEKVFYTDKKLSVLKATDEELKLLPPVYIQCGEKEMFRIQCEDFFERMEFCGKKCSLDVANNMMFCFQMADEFLSESHLALERIGKYLTKATRLEEDEKLERDRILRVNNIMVD